MIPAHIAESLQNLLAAQQTLENALADISESNWQSVQRAIEIIKKAKLLLAEQYPIIKDFTVLARKAHRLCLDRLDNR